MFTTGCFEATNLELKQLFLFTNKQLGDVQRQLLLGAQRQYALQALCPDDEEFVTIGKRKRPSLLDDLKPVLVQVARSSLLQCTLLLHPIFVYCMIDSITLRHTTYLASEIDAVHRRFQAARRLI